MPPASRGGLISAMMGPKSAASFRPKEKYLIFLVLATFGFVCFGAIFFLPTEKTGSDDSPPNMNRVYRVYKQLQDVQDILLPAPPLNNDDGDGIPQVNPHHNHFGGVLARPDPHKVEDRARLLANVEMDSELERIRKQQIEKNPKQVIAKPVIIAQDDKKPDHISSSELAPPIEAPRGHSANEPKITGGEDPNPEVRKKRDHVKQMMKHAWDGYVKYAWGKNEVRPISLRGHSASIFGSASMGATIIDALDTLYIMGMKDEYDKARDWVAENLDFGKMVRFFKLL